MTAVLMIRCDNPDCKAIGTPEFIPGQDGERKKRNAKVVAPYGWHQGEGWCVGTVPMFEYVACSSECVGPAITEQVRRFREAEER